MMPAALLRLEGGALLLAALFFYHFSGFGWGWFALLFLWPDIFMLGYLLNPTLGSRLYNLVHNEILPMLLVISSIAFHQPLPLAFGLIWLSHIGFDRALGYGLKYPTFFKDTHLQRLT